MRIRGLGCVASSLADGALGDGRHYGKFPRLDAGRQEVKSRLIFVCAQAPELDFWGFSNASTVTYDFVYYHLRKRKENMPP